MIIGNPPYNANQQSENDNNKNRVYTHIDARIKDTYIKASSARKTKLYDMYVRFLRWASDRLSDDGILAFVSNSSFLHKNSFDGVRACLEREFNALWAIDLKGDARSSGEARRKQGGNVFGNKIKVGIAIYLLVKRKGVNGFRFRYDAVNDYVGADDKIDILDAPLDERRMSIIQPNSSHEWLDQATEDRSWLLALADKRTTSAKTTSKDRAVFKLYTLGVSTNRDEWLYDRSAELVEKKARHLIDIYDAIPIDAVTFPGTMKWSRNLKRKLAHGRREEFDSNRITHTAYRPFSPRWLYQSDLFIDEQGLSRTLFPQGGSNTAICSGLFNALY